MRLKVRYQMDELTPAGLKIVDSETALHADSGLKRWKCVSCGMWVSHRHRSNQCNPCFLSSYKTRKEIHVPA